MQKNVMNSDFVFTWIWNSYIHSPCINFAVTKIASERHECKKKHFMWDKINFDLNQLISPQITHNWYAIKIMKLTKDPVKFKLSFLITSKSF